MILQDKGTTEIEGPQTLILFEYEWLTRRLLKHIKKEDLEKAFKLGEMTEKDALNYAKNETIKNKGLSQEELDKEARSLVPLIKFIF